ncbi:MAG: zinc-binding dehydrogenase [Acidimicrobiia bacterium]|nr:zinc-binding dehydrogenase [Acidimicrobiia bacterium]
MRAAVLVGHGGPDQLVVREVADPVLGPGDVCVEVTAAAVNNTDIWTREGAYGPNPEHPTGWLGLPIECPRIQGGDAAGLVRAVGDGVDATLVGRRVLVDPAEYDAPGPDATPVRILGSERDGGFAERLVVPVGQVHDVTDSPLDDGELAALPIAAGTAMGMLDRAHVGSGDTVVVTGASGGVGMAAVQLAAALGGRVIAVSSAGKGPVLRDAGAADVVDRAAPDLHRRVADLAPGGVDVVVDVVGGDGFGEWVGVLRRHGRIVVAGAIAGPHVTIDLRALYLEQRRIIGSTMHTRAQFERLVDLARRGSVRPVVAARLPLEEIHEALRLLRAGDAIGKIVLLPPAGV